MHPPDVKAAAVALLEEGLNDCEVSRRTGIPRTTIRDWRRGSAPQIVRARCPRCRRPAKRIAFVIEDYAEILGMYLGDGCISTAPRTARLRLALDPKYPELIAHSARLLSRFFAQNAVSQVRGGAGGYGGACAYLSVYNSHLTCLFPQHGAGPKHQRRIALAPWQMAAVLSAPWSFLRGCFHSDGCRFVNRTGRYEYPSYAFSNRSGQIARLVNLACDRVGLKQRLTYDARRGLWAIRVNRRADVRRMDEKIGPKR